MIYLITLIQSYEDQSFNNLGLTCQKMKIKSLKNDSVYDIITTKDINISNVNWCTPFNEIEDVLLEYSILQYGMEMHLKQLKSNLRTILNPTILKRDIFF